MTIMNLLRWKWKYILSNWGLCESVFRVVGASSVYTWGRHKIALCDNVNNGDDSDVVDDGYGDHDDYGDDGVVLMKYK